MDQLNLLVTITDRNRLTGFLELYKQHNLQVNLVALGKGTANSEVLDYLGLMHADGKAENRQLEVSEISRSLKAIALELKVPVLACAQLSRASTARVDKRPALQDLRDSGSIEQDADVVMFIHREGYYDPNAEEKNVGEIIVSKQRNGPLGTVKVAWLSEYTTYANLAPEASGYGDAPF